ncbi:GNAT family N-acetyltransferase [Marinifilum flexuosum]|uniref:Acetyltransferase (GNAT) family protein n=1 Tax=Marinifilum flexuosum TaxID=1117708 RepID=A0A419X9I7_9BACT|nr:GNAT family N-acetyltransferase [Marinifilum flexuosum]RKE04306.1 acetyltransferase (GNAT) family protein [Marinifilum flexuosum]
MYRFETISIEELENFQYNTNCPSCRFEWIYSWYQVFEKVENNIVGFKKKPFIILVYKEEKLTAIIPLLKLVRIYLKFIRISFLEFFGQQWSSLGNDILIVEEVDKLFYRELRHWIRKNISYDIIFLKYIPKQSELVKCFRLFHYSVAPCVQLNRYEGYQDFTKKVYSKKFREELKRTARKLARENLEYTIEVRAVSKENLKLIKHISKSKEIDGKSFLYGNFEKEAFHLSIYESFPSQIILLKLNDEIVAYSTSIDWQGKRLAIDSSFNRRFRKYGIGIHCVDSFIRNAFDDKMKKLSLGMGHDSYKYRFCDDMDQFFMCFDYKISWKSLLALPYIKYRLIKTDKEILAKNQKISAIIEKNKQKSRNKEELKIKTNHKTSINKINISERVEM